MPQSLKDTKKKICFFNSTKSWGGGEKWHFDVASGIDKEKFDSIVFTNPQSELYKKCNENGINARTFKVSNLSFLNPFKVKKLAKIFSEHNFDTIILNLPSDLKLAGMAAQKANIKQIIYRRGSAIPIKNSFLNRFLFRNVITEIIANSQKTKNTILKNNISLFDPDKIHVLYNGIDIEKFPTKNKVEFTYQKKKEIIIGNAGRLDPQKAQYFLIDLAKKLNDLDVIFKIKIAGDGILKDKLQNEIEKNGLSHQVELLGFVENVPEFMKHIDVFVLTSKWEGFGYVLAEAMAAYKPVIAFDISSNPELIQHEETGYLIEPFQVDQMAKAIYHLTLNEEEYRRLAMNTRKRVEDFFTKNQMLKKVEEFLRK